MIEQNFDEKKVCTDDCTDDTECENTQTNESDSESNNSILENLTNENEALKNQYLRAVADYTNLKKRTEKERKELLLSASAKLVGKMLPVIDNFERALPTISDPEISKGINMIYKQMLDLLKSEGLEKIESEGEQFDPHIHEALMQVEDLSVEDNTILQVFEPGYRFNNKLLRAAKVKVSSN